MPQVHVYNRKYADYAIGVQRYNAKSLDPFKTYFILTLGATFTDESTLQDIVEAELPEKNGYARMPYRIGNPLRVQSSNPTTNVFRTSINEDLTPEQPIYLFDEIDAFELRTPDSDIPLVTGVAYYVLNPDSGSGEFQISATPGGPAIDIKSTESQFFVARAGSWNPELNRYESALDKMFATAGAAPEGLSYDTGVIIHSTTVWGSYGITKVDTSLNEFSTDITHKIEENDVIFFTAGDSGVLPTSTGGGSLAGRKFRAKDIVGKKFKIDEGGNSISLASTGSGAIRVFSDAGLWEMAIREDDVDANLPIVIPANETRQFTHRFAQSFL
jgi:hypothetical protein